jgi:hypothetical protein
MRRRIIILTIGILVAAGGLLLTLVRPLTVTHAAFVGLPLNQPAVFKFSVDKAAALKGKTPREKKDQARDWLLYAAVSESGATSKEIGEIVFDLPAIREGYMNHVGNFEYGEIRSRAIGDGQVIALLPAADENIRIDQLAHIADEQRKNTGEIPATFLPIEYRLDLDTNGTPTAELTRRDPIDGKAIFTEKYGYFEKDIRTLDDLKNFLTQVDGSICRPGS